MDEESRRTSLKLFDVMNHVGVSDHMRQLRRNVSIRNEIWHSITDNMMGLPLSTYSFGSSIEDTTTPNMESDLDVVMCDERFPVIQDIEQARPGVSLLMVADRYSKPGYVKLQEVYDGMPLTKQNCNIYDYSTYKYDKVGRMCRKHFTSQGKIQGITERSGPADSQSNIPGIAPLDAVYAFRSNTFPPFAVDSLLECSRIGWLTSDEVNEMINMGCLLVGVGHPTSEERDLEWRISFSLQERQLMFKLKSTQHICYVLLKLIKNMITLEPDVGKSITSYHMKTCLFSGIIKTRQNRWEPEYLIDCTLTCLHELLQCLRNGNLPNFFIKENNMFERRVYGPVRERLISHLQKILQDGCRVFYHIQSDGIGEMLNGNVDQYIIATRERGKKMFDVYQNACGDLAQVQMRICTHLNSLSNKEAEVFLSQQLQTLASTNMVTEHSPEDTKRAIRDLEHVFHQLYAQHLASLAFSTDIYDTKHHLLQSCAHHLARGMTWNLMSGKLLYMTVLYRQGNIEMCPDLLEELEQRLCAEVESLCECKDFMKYVNWNLVKRLLAGYVEPQSIMESCMAVCTLFHPLHIEIVPPALNFEFYRSVGTPPETRVEFYDDWYDWAVVDAKVYLYFMQYLVYSHLNRHRDKQIAIENLWTVLQEDDNLGHRETGYNLLGWICGQEGHIWTAACCFLQSWRIRPGHNAAKWHMLVLIYRQLVASGKNVCLQYVPSGNWVHLVKECKPRNELKDEANTLRWQSGNVPSHYRLNPFVVPRISVHKTK